MADVATAVGVSKMAVSLAMNGRPGVSEATRERIRRAAAEMGWEPDPAARVLAGGRADSVGLVLRRTVADLALDTFYMQLFAAVSGRLGASGASLALHVAADEASEDSTYRSLARRRSVDAVLVTDVALDDRRSSLLAELKMPTVALGGPGTAFATLHADELGPIRQVVEHLKDRGFERLIRVAGDFDFSYTSTRTEAFLSTASESGVDAGVVSSAAGAEAGRGVTREVLEAEPGRLAIVYENDLLALGGVEAIRIAGRRIPDDVGVVSWDGSALADAIRPRLTTIRRDIGALGSRAAEELLRTPSAPGSGFLLASGEDYSRPQLVVGETT